MKTAVNRFLIFLIFLCIASYLAFAEDNIECPYAIFGDRTPVRDIDRSHLETPWQVYILLSDSTLAKMKLHGEVISIIDSENNILAEFRISNISKPLFAGADPKASKMPSASPYTYCFGNPILFIDPSGEEPTPYQASLMCRASYKDKTIANGQTISDYEEAISFLANENWYPCDEFNKTVKQNHNAGTGIGMQSMIFKRTNGDKTEYAFAFAGTNSLEDAVVDATQVYGIIPDVGMALEGVSQLKNIIGGAELTFVAHSLGSVLASAASMKTGDKAITFNPAVISPATRLFYGLKGNGNIINYISSTQKVLGVQIIKDPVTLLQNALGLYAPGKSIKVAVNGFLSHSINAISDALMNK